jgi:phospholipid transport system substrate-binding protein
MGVLLGQSAFADVAEEYSPIEVIETTAASLQQQLVGQKSYYKDNLAELYILIDKLLLPRFDVEYAGKQVLGRVHWTAATEEQRVQFINVFYSFLVRTYASGILEFDQANMDIFPDLSYSKDASKVLVSTQVKLDAGDGVLVKYALRDTADGWKIYDVRIDGVSYIKNYRSQFDAEISARGIDAVIRRLELELDQTPEPEKTDT